jgi:Putative peptidoglycan binding domain
MESHIDDLVDALIRACQGYTSRLREYCDLALCAELDDNSATKLEAIYTEAEQDPLLNFFIHEFDRIWGERIGLLNAHSIQDYQNQQAWLREHLEETLLDQQYRLEIQQLLREQRLYQGPLDGVWGDRSVTAIKQFRMKVQRRLQEQGFYHGAIDGELGEQSVTAVRRFQKIHHLKDDGVLGRQTVSVLQPELLI